MKGNELLKKALERLEGMSSAEVKKRTTEKGIVIPSEPSLSELVNHFIFDLGGSFDEIINSKEKNPKWIDDETIKKEYIVIKERKSHKNVALLV